MHAPNASHLVRIWDWGRDQHPVDRALALLSEATDTPTDDLALLNIAVRDRMLLELRMLLMGETLEVKSACPKCAADVEFEIAGKELLFDPPDGDGGVMTQPDGFEVAYRYPNSLDLAAVADAASEDDGLRVLITRCVDSVNGPDGALDAVPNDLVAQVADVMREAMPQSDIRFNLGCPDCAQRWKTTLDIGSFLWAEVSSEAARVLRDTAELALRFGWSEHEILRMSAQRRRFYLEMDG